MPSISFGLIGKAQEGSSTPTSPTAANLALHAGDTGVLAFCSGGATPAVGTGITGGGTWSQIAALTNGAARVEWWATAVGAALAASSLSMAYTRNSADSVEVFAASYLNVGSLGIHASNSGTAINPLVDLILQDANGWALAAFAMADSAVATVLPTANIGSLRAADNVSAAGTYDMASAVTDHTAAAAGSIRNQISYSHSTGVWSAVAIELRPAVAGGLITRRTLHRFGSHAGGRTSR